MTIIHVSRLGSDLSPIVRERMSRDDDKECVGMWKRHSSEDSVISGCERKKGCDRDWKMQACLEDVSDPKEVDPIRSR